MFQRSILQLVLPGLSSLVVQSNTGQCFGKPMISYHHFNTGHVSGTGDRIRNMDSALSEFLIKMAYNPYTVTIVLSDHGHTRTDYSKTFEGRLELFDPMFFMVLPYHAAKLLGQRRVAALVENQGRLFYDR